MELNRYKKYGDKLDEIAEQVWKRDKSVQLMISIIISHTHAPLQLCVVTPEH